MAGTLVLVASTALVGAHTWACCKFVSGNSYRIGCDGPTMEPDTLDRRAAGSLAGS